MTARCHPVSLPGDTEDTDTRDRIRIRIRPGKTLKLHLPEGYDMGATSTTDLEPLSDHGAPPRARRIAAAHVTLPRASRHFSARQVYVDASFLNPASHSHIGVTCDWSDPETEDSPTDGSATWLRGTVQNRMTN